MNCINEDIMREIGQTYGSKNEKDIALKALFDNPACLLKEEDYKEESSALGSLGLKPKPAL